MPAFTVVKFVKASPSRTFDVFADIRNAPGRVHGIRKIDVLTPGPVGVGTAFKETRVMFGREATETMTFTVYDPPTRYELGAVSCGVAFRTAFLFAADGAGTRVDVTTTTTAQTLAAKIVGPLMGWMMRGMMKKCLQADLDQVTLAAEASAAGVTS